MKTILKTATIKKLMKNITNKRISNEAAKTLTEHLEQQAKKITEQAQTQAEYQARNTIKKQDIQTIIDTEKNKHQNWET